MTNIYLNDPEMECNEIAEDKGVVESILVVDGKIACDGKEIHCDSIFNDECSTTYEPLYDEENFSSEDGYKCCRRRNQYMIC